MEGLTLDVYDVARMLSEVVRANAATADTVPFPFPATIGLSPKGDLKPFTGVEWDYKRKFPDGKRCHIIAYRAYDAFGLIGSEMNGVAVVALPNDEGKDHEGAIIATEIACESSGYFGLSQRQLDVAYLLSVCPWSMFKTVVNACPNKRGTLK